MRRACRRASAGPSLDPATIDFPTEAG
jgi:hypothetical protein